ncbi:MAG: COX15/CtaA family protein, partial [Gammaproteobacteria bacterium]|nr:COX15/CtaA family protein [Gammaproteobacteria bacterium]
SMSLSILGLLGWVVLREHRFWKPIGELSARMQSRLRPRALLGLFLVILQVLLGGWMSANYAALACPDFPTCQGDLWPQMDVLTGFVLWQDIGMDYEGVLLNMEAATAVHMAHRLGALATLLYVGWLALHTIRVGRLTILWRYGLVIFLLLLAQVTLGIITTLTHLPLPLIVAHSGAAALLMLSLITLNHVLRPRA